MSCRRGKPDKTTARQRRLNVRVRGRRDCRNVNQRRNRGYKEIQRTSAGMRVRRFQMNAVVMVVVGFEKMGMNQRRFTIMGMQMKKRSVKRN